jgi:hypothetical protein
VPTPLASTSTNIIFHYHHPELIHVRAPTQRCKIIAIVLTDLFGVWHTHVLFEVIFP